MSGLAETPVEARQFLNRYDPTVRPEYERGISAIADWCHAHGRDLRSLSDADVPQLPGRVVAGAFVAFLADRAEYEASRSPAA